MQCASLSPHKNLDTFILKIVLMKVDLHTHSTASDGSLSPRTLVEEAVKMDINMLSITDHDTTDAYLELSSINYPSLELIPGIEFSTQWQGVGIHVIGLNVKPASEALVKGVKTQRDARVKRARRIAEKLEKLGVEGVWEGVQQIAGKSVIGRPHFSQYLVENKHVKTTSEAFERYLGSGKTGDVKCFWMSFEEIVDCIRKAGGTAVLAHPAKYKLTNTRLSRLLDDFIDVGGEAMELISGNQNRDITEKLRSLCIKKKLLASCGSDFHQPGQRWANLGMVQALPEDCEPVWETWR